MSTQATEARAGGGPGPADGLVLELEQVTKT